MSDSAADSLSAMKNRERTPEDAVAIGRVIGGVGRRIAVCRDADPSSDMMANALISGLLSVGTEVWDAGVVPTPVAAFAAKKMDALASVCASGIPGNISGISLYNSDGSRFREEQERELFVKHRDKTYRLQSFKGTCSLRMFERVEDDYVRAVSRNHKAPRSPVILDCGCGCVSSCAPHVLTTIGTDLVCLNAHRDPKFRPRSRAASLGGHEEEILASDTGSIGLSINGDGTKLSVSDERGRLLSDQEKLALLLLYLKPSCFVMPVSLSAMIDDAFYGRIGGNMDTVRKANSSDTVIRTDGSIEMTVAKIKENNADLAVLGDGSFIFPQYSLCPDAIVASAVFAEIAAKNSLCDIVSSFPEYIVMDDIVRFTGNREMISKRLSDKLSDSESMKVYKIDGWRVEMSGGWFAVSFNEITDGYIDIRAESRDRTYVVTMIEMAKGIVFRCI